MTFNSLEYLVFFAVVLALYFRFGAKGQNRLMVLAGAVFYGAFDWRFLGLLYASCVVDFFVGQAIERSDEQRRRRQFLAISVVFQVGILAFFKYFNFFTDSAERVLDAVGLSVDPVTLDIVLPVGISFYTFQTLAYVFGVYRRQVPAERDLITFATFVSWFPQLVAGPIERATSLLPQVQRRRVRPEGPVIESGLMLIVRGLVKKVVVADSLATFVTTVYSGQAKFGWQALTLATVGFAVQVYGDFSGYSDIARGSSRLLGVELRRNFEQPFLSRTMQEFWQRWHTSLGSWFVEFVAQPLGGARHGRLRAEANVLLIFVLIGLWHGAAWHFVAWGFLNGCFVLLWRRIPVPKSRHPMKIRTRDLLGIVFTFSLFCLGVILFRAMSLRDAARILEGIVTFRDGAGGPASGALVPIMLGLVLLLDLDERRRRVRAIETLRVRPQLGGISSPPEAAMESPTFAMRPWAAGVKVGLMVVAILLFSGGTPTPFIYFQF
jgi:alginate O-acetyltransferase complex protein AlgI